MSDSREETPLRLVGRRTDPVKRTSVTSVPQPLAPPAFTPPTQSPGWCFFVFLRANQIQLLDSFGIGGSIISSVWGDEGGNDSQAVSL